MLSPIIRAYNASLEQSSEAFFLGESAITRNFVNCLSVYFPRETEFIKHSDRFTAGIPDLSITLARSVLWIEVKVPRFCRDKCFHLDKKDLRRAQWERAKRLQGMYLLLYGTQLRGAAQAFYVLGDCPSSLIMPSATWVEVAQVIRSQFAK